MLSRTSLQVETIDYTLNIRLLYTMKFFFFIYIKALHIISNKNVNFCVLFNAGQNFEQQPILAVDSSFSFIFFSSSFFIFTLLTRIIHDCALFAYLLSVFRFFFLYFLFEFRYASDYDTKFYIIEFSKSTLFLQQIFRNFFFNYNNKKKISFGLFILYQKKKYVLNYTVIQTSSQHCKCKGHEDRGKESK